MIGDQSSTHQLKEILDFRDFASVFRGESIVEKASFGEPMSTVDWKEEKESEVFENTLRGLENRRRVDPAFTVEDAKSALEHLYILQGNDWLGRGELGDIITAATIAAYEHFIHDWYAGAGSAPEEPRESKHGH